MIESGMAPVIVAFEEAPHEVLNRLSRGFISAGAAARKLQSYIVQVPPKARDLLLKNGHVQFVEGFGDQFVVMEKGTLYGEDTGLCGRMRSIWGWRATYCDLKAPVFKRP